MLSHCGSLFKKTKPHALFLEVCIGTKMYWHCHSSASPRSREQDATLVPVPRCLITGPSIRAQDSAFSTLALEKTRSSQTVSVFSSGSPIASVLSLLSQFIRNDLSAR